MAPASTAVSSARAQLDEVYSLVADWDPSFLQERGAVNVDQRLLPDALGVPKITNTAQKFALVARFKTQQPVSFVTTEGLEKLGWHTDCSIDAPRAEGGTGPPNRWRVGDVIPAPKNIGEFSFAIERSSFFAGLEVAILYHKGISRRLRVTASLIRNKPTNTVGTFCRGYSSKEGQILSSTSNLVVKTGICTG